MINEIIRYYDARSKKHKKYLEVVYAAVFIKSSHMTPPPLRQRDTVLDYSVFLPSKNY
jgi:hypothetical protein